MRIRSETRRLEIVFFFVVVLSLTTGSVANAQGRRDVPNSIRKELIDAVLKDDEDQRGCLEGLDRKEQDGFRNNSSIDPVDLNHDGRTEYRVTGSGNCACGNANCSIWVYQRNGQVFKQILMTMGINFKVGGNSHNGFSDIIVDSHDSASTVYRTFYSFDGKQYKEYRNDFVNLETGQSKPAQVPIHFLKGTTSTTVYGRVSIGFPDTYALKAQPGQTISIEILRPANGVKFLVNESKSSSAPATWQKEWSGTVTGAGKYTITVDSDSKVAYSMKVTVE